MCIRDRLAYDEEHNTQLLYTLETYFNNCQNAVKTSKALFIHRNTLLYRLDQMCIRDSVPGYPSSPSGDRRCSRRPSASDSAAQMYLSNPRTPPWRWFLSLIHI